MEAFQYSWQKDAEGKDSFTVSIKPCSRIPKTWKEELRNAARVIAKEAGEKPLWLCAGGGIDSEVMCEVFFQEGINFSVITVEHIGRTNRTDTRYIKKWCYERDIPHELYQIDMPQFIIEDVPLYISQSYIAEYVFHYVYLKLLEIVEAKSGYAVMGNGSQVYEECVTYPEVCVSFTAGDIAPLEWMRRNNTVHTPLFFCSTPELCLSFIRNEFTQFVLSHTAILAHNANSHTIKRVIYQAEFPKLEKRGRYMGHQRLAKLRRTAEQQIHEAFGKRIRKFDLPVSQFVKQLTGDV